jgi:hypothetical protein
VCPRSQAQASSSSSSSPLLPRPPRLACRWGQPWSLVCLGARCSSLPTSLLGLPLPPPRLRHEGTSRRSPATVAAAAAARRAPPWRCLRPQHLPPGPSRPPSTSSRASRRRCWQSGCSGGSTRIPGRVRRTKRRGQTTSLDSQALMKVRRCCFCPACASAVYCCPSHKAPSTRRAAAEKSARRAARAAAIEALEKKAAARWRRGVASGRIITPTYIRGPEGRLVRAPPPRPPPLTLTQPQIRKAYRQLIRNGKMPDPASVAAAVSSGKGERTGTQLRTHPLSPPLYLHLNSPGAFRPRHRGPRGARCCGRQGSLG